MRATQTYRHFNHQITENIDLKHLTLDLKHSQSAINRKVFRNAVKKVKHRERKIDSMILNTSIMRLKSLGKNRDFQEKSNKNESWVYEAAEKPANSFLTHGEALGKSVAESYHKNNNLSNERPLLKTFCMAENVTHETSAPNSTHNRNDTMTESKLKISLIDVNRSIKEPKKSQKKHEKVDLQTQYENDEFLAPKVPSVKRQMSSGKVRYMKPEIPPNLYESRVYGLPMYLSSKRSKKVIEDVRLQPEAMKKMKLKKNGFDSCSTSNNKGFPRKRPHKVNNPFQKFKNLLENELEISSIYGDDETLVDTEEEHSQLETMKNTESQAIESSTGKRESVIDSIGKSSIDECSIQDEKEMPQSVEIPLRIVESTVPDNVENSDTSLTENKEDIELVTLEKSNLNDAEITQQPSPVVERIAIQPVEVTENHVNMVQRQASESSCLNENKEQSQSFSVVKTNVHDSPDHEVRNVTSVCPMRSPTVGDNRSYRRSSNFRLVTTCCKRKCYQSVSHEVQIREFESFQRKNSLKQFDQISDYLSAAPTKTKHRRWNYFVLLDSVEGVSVCRAFLIQMLQISSYALSKVQQKLKKSTNKSTSITSKFDRVILTKKYAPVIVCKMLQKFYDVNGINMTNIMRVFGGTHNLYKSFVEYYESVMNDKPKIDMKTFFNRYRDFLPNRE
ncbi:DgyrCDS3620 [Dimorphilus gyrociliatus]|uniref:DgyrCDS3620 n=1 Tax=Dimorphilus gyrociliatus TaxID=2664684 RepID=A0A7I8VE92_9ANNE|nr:DgyrCDS3620 [Dimorphilus gyrociliatus]